MTDRGETHQNRPEDDPAQMKLLASGSQQHGRKVGERCRSPNPGKRRDVLGLGLQEPENHHRQSEDCSGEMKEMRGSGIFAHMRTRFRDSPRVRRDLHTSAPPQLEPGPAVQAK